MSEFLKKILSPERDLDKVLILAKEAFSELDTSVVQSEVYKLMLKSKCEFFQILQLGHISFSYGSSNQSTTARTDKLNINMKQLADLDWRGLSDREVKKQIQAFIVIQFILKIRQNITNKESHSNIENLTAEYIARQILKTAAIYLSEPRVFRWSKFKDNNTLDYLICAIAKESAIRDTEVVKRAIQASFLQGKDFTSSDFLDSYPDYIGLLFLELTKKLNDGNSEMEYREHIAERYDISVDEMLAVRKNEKFERRISEIERVKQICLEEFNNLGWDELTSIYNQLRRKLGLHELKYCYPDYIKFIMSSRTEPWANLLMFVPEAQHKWEADENGNLSFDFSYGQDLEIVLNLTGLINIHFDGINERDLRRSLKSIFIHELCHIYGRKMSIIHSYNLSTEGRPTYEMSSGVSIKQYRLTRADNNGVKAESLSVGVRLNEVLTEMCAQYLENSYRPKADASHGEHRYRSYEYFVNSFGVLVVCLSKYTSVPISQIIGSFFHYYFGEGRDIYDKNYLEYIFSEIEDGEKRDGIKLAFWELLKNDTNPRSLNREYFENLARKFKLTKTEIAKAVVIYEFI